MLTASADRTVKLWRGEACVRTFSGHTDAVRTLACLPGLGFLSGSNDGTVRLWELGGECLRVLQARGGQKCMHRFGPCAAPLA